MIWMLVACTQATGLGAKPEEQETVTGSGGAELTPNPLDIVDCDPEYARSGTVTLTSVGDSNLRIYTASIPSGGPFFTDAIRDLEDAEFAPGDSTEITIVATLPAGTTEPVDGIFRLHTNDPENVDLDLPIRAIPTDWVPADDTGASDTGAGDTGDSAAG